jgi:hypothetical protein
MWIVCAQIKILILFHQEQNRSILFDKHALFVSAGRLRGRKRVTS